MLLDGDRLRERMEEMQSSLSQAVEQRIADNEGQKDEAALRMEGGIANLHVLLTQLHHFEHAPPRARRADPFTSHKAAQELDPESLSRLKQGILRVLSREPMTDDRIREILMRYGFDYEKTSFTKRRGELVEEGLVRDSGRRVKSEKNRDMIVWELVPRGN